MYEIYVLVFVTPNLYLFFTKMKGIKSISLKIKSNNKTKNIKKT